MKLLTLKEFNKLYNDHFNERMGEVGSKSKVFKITKRKVVQQAVVETRYTESGVPYFHTVSPKVTKEVVDTNGLEDLYIAFAKIIFGFTLVKMYTTGVPYVDKKTGRRFLKHNPNRGQSDLEGVLPPYGRKFCIEVKQRYEKHLDDQKAFQKRVIDAGGIYEIARNFDRFQTVMLTYLKPLDKYKHLFE